MGKQPSHFGATPTVSTMHLQLLKDNDDFLLCKVLDLPRMLVEKGHAYGKVLQNQKYLWWKKGLGMSSSYMFGPHVQGSCLPLRQQSTSSTLDGDGCLHVSLMK